MRSHLRTIAVLLLAVGLVALFLREVDLRGVFRESVRAQPGWLLLSLASMYANLAIRALRWRYLLEPLGKTSFSNAFRAMFGMTPSSLLEAERESRRAGSRRGAQS